MAPHRPIPKHAFGSFDTFTDSRYLAAAWHRFWMPFYRDLSPHTERGDRVLAVGWLAHGEPFATGAFPEDLLACLLSRPPDVVSAGSHWCELCLPTANRFFSEESPRVASGSYVFVIPGTRGTTYVAPALICHYITEHGYAPPEEFTAALRVECARRSPDKVRIAARSYSYARAVAAFQEELAKLRIAFTHPTSEAEGLMFGNLRAKSKFRRLHHVSDIEAVLVHHAPNLQRAEAESAAAQLWEAWHRFLGHEDFETDWLQLSGPQRFA